MSNITLGNDTPFIAHYVVLNGEQVIARIPGILPGAQLQVPTNETYQVIATTVLNGNTYISDPVGISGAASFLAQVVQLPSHGTYEFNVVELPSTDPNQLQFQKTTIGPVTFTITRDGIPLQTVVVNDAFQIRTITIGRTFSIYAVINGITTATVVTTDPNATVVAITDTSTFESGHFTLVVS